MCVFLTKGGLGNQRMHNIEGARIHHSSFVFSLKNISCISVEYVVIQYRRLLQHM